MFSLGEEFWQRIELKTNHGMTTDDLMRYEWVRKMSHGDTLPEEICFIDNALSHVSLRSLFRELSN